MLELNDKNDTHSLSFHFIDPYDVKQKTQICAFIHKHESLLHTTRLDIKV